MARKNSVTKLQRTPTKKWQRGVTKIAASRYKNFSEVLQNCSEVLHSKTTKYSVYAVLRTQFFC